MGVLAKNSFGSYPLLSGRVDRIPRINCILYLLSITKIFTIRLAVLMAARDRNS